MRTSPWRRGVAPKGSRVLSSHVSLPDPPGSDDFFDSALMELAFLNTADTVEPKQPESAVVDEAISTRLFSLEFSTAPTKVFLDTADDVDPQLTLASDANAAGENAAPLSLKAPVATVHLRRQIHDYPMPWPPQTARRQATIQSVLDVLNADAGSDVFVEGVPTLLEPGVRGHMCRHTHK